MLRSFVKESEEMWIRLILPSDICYVYYIWPCFTKKDIGISWNILTLPTDCKYYLLNEMNLVSLCFTAFFFSMIYSLCFAFFGSWNFIFHQPQCWFRSPFCRLDIFMIFSILLWETGLPESKAFNHYFLPLTWKVSGSGETLCLM